VYAITFDYINYHANFVAALPHRHESDALPHINIQI